MNTNLLNVRAFKAGIPGFAIHPNASIQPTIQNNIYSSVKLEPKTRIETNHLTQSLHNYISYKLEDRTYNSSFLNSTSIDSQEATTQFIQSLESMTDYGLQNIKYLHVSDSFFSNSSNVYQSFQHPQSSNYLQESLLNIADALDSDSPTFNQLEQSARQVLQSYGLPITQNSAAELLRGMSNALHTQLGNIGHLVDLKV